MTTVHVPLDERRRWLANRIARRLERLAGADVATREAVGALVAAADPARADAMHPVPSDGAPLVERLAVWALARADQAAVTAAEDHLDRSLDRLLDELDDRAAGRVAVRARTATRHRRACGA